MYRAVSGQIKLKTCWNVIHQCLVQSCSFSLSSHDTTTLLLCFSPFFTTLSRQTRCPLALLFPRRLPGPFNRPSPWKHPVSCCCGAMWWTASFKYRVRFFEAWWQLDPCCQRLGTVCFGEYAWRSEGECWCQHRKKSVYVCHIRDEPGSYEGLTWLL